MMSQVGTVAEGYKSRLVNQPVFGVKRPFWRDDDNHAVIMSDAHSELRLEVLKRDNYTCRFCGFKAAKFNEFHHVDGDHDNCVVQNVVTACNLCHQVHHLGAVAMASKGEVIFLPELTQTELNSIARAMYVLELSGDIAVLNKFESLKAIFRFRGADTLKAVFGGDVINVLSIATSLADITERGDALYENRAEVFKGLRLYPSMTAFSDGQLEYYAANNRSIFAKENWSALARQLAA